MAANADIFFEHDRWGRNLGWSVALHIAFAGFVVLYTVVVPGGRGGTWGAGGGGDAIGVTLISTVPLPASPVETQNVSANESKGLSQSLPKVEEKEPEAIPIPDKNAKKKPKQTSATQRKPQPEPEEASNVVPFGEGGPVSGPYGIFNAGWGERRVRLYRWWRRFWQPLRLVRARGAAESFGELVEIRGGRAHYRGPPSLSNL